MVDLSLLEPGMKVKIVDEWCKGCRQNPNGRMDGYLGTVVTVFRVFTSHILIEEDAEGRGYEVGGHWMWLPEAIDHIIEDESEWLHVATDEELELLLSSIWEYER